MLLQSLQSFDAVTLVGALSLVASFVFSLIRLCLKLATRKD